MQHRVYTDPRWQPFRTAVLQRDNHQCTVARLLGGDCHTTLHIHHLTPVSEGGAPFDPANATTVCAIHHPQVEALRRALLERRLPARRRCRHTHPYRYGREECERRLTPA